MRRSRTGRGKALFDLPPLTASLIVLVKKKDGSNRLRLDYKSLNRNIIRDRYPLQLIEDQLDHLQGTRVFSTLDLENGFFHVCMDEACINTIHHLLRPTVNLSFCGCHLDYAIPLLCFRGSLTRFLEI